VGLYALHNLNQRGLLTESLTRLVAQLAQRMAPKVEEMLLFGSVPSAGESGRSTQLRLQLHRVYGGFLYAVVCGALFLLCQLYEYQSAGYAMGDGIYGSVFYGLTGLHGLHVLAGLGLLLLVLRRLWQGFFDADQNTADGPTGGV
jgi:heme/copper-type cytochrome/quinol oxidase subunit 3